MPPRFRAPPGFIRPCLASPADVAPSGSEWTHEIKYDGYRIIALRAADGSVRLWSRNGIDHRAEFPGIVADLKRLDRPLIIDGEAVLFLPSGKTDRHALRSKHHKDQVSLVAFDLLFLDDVDMRRLSLVERKASLKAIVGESFSNIQYCESIDGDGEEIYRHVCTMGLEGIVSKRKDSFYKSGRSKAWLKVKCPEYH